jgi:hypothetical protein
LTGKEPPGDAASPGAGRQTRLDDFLARLDGHPWFSCLGEPASSADEEEARLLAQSLMIGDLGVAWVGDLHAAAALLRRVDHSRAWMDAEAEEVQRLTDRTETAFGANDTTDGLNRVMHRASDMAIGPAAVACARAGIANEALPKVAAGAAAQAAHGMALVLAAEAPAGHIFAARFRLFAGGRWPLTVAGGLFHVL